MIIRKIIPTGSPLWYPCFRAKNWLSYLVGRGLRPEKVLPHVVNQNIFLEQYRAIYIYIPKVACSSIKRLCADMLNLSPADGDLVEEIHKIRFPSTRKYQIYKRYADYFKFAFVRNPWDRLVSCYRDKINDQAGHVYERYDNRFAGYLEKRGIRTEGLSFDAFVDIVANIPDHEAEGHIRSQHLYLQDNEGRYLPDFVGRFETLAQDFEAVADHLRVGVRVPHLRQTSRRDYHNYYNPQTWEIVGQRYAVDIKMFGYEDQLGLGSDLGE